MRTRKAPIKQASPWGGESQGKRRNKKKKAFVGKKVVLREEQEPGQTKKKNRYSHRGGESTGFASLRRKKGLFGPGGKMFEAICAIKEN